MPVHNRLKRLGVVVCDKALQERGVVIVHSPVYSAQHAQNRQKFLADERTGRAGWDSVDYHFSWETAAPMLRASVDERV